MNDVKVAADVGQAYAAMLHLQGLTVKSMVVRGMLSEQEARALVLDAAQYVKPDNLFRPAFDELIQQFP